MNKLLTKIVGLSIGLAMAIGVGVAVGGKDVKTANAATVTGNINFGSATGSLNVNAASVSGDDSNENTWTVTTAGTTSFTPNASYAQIGSSNKPATSITFTTTLSAAQTIKSMSAKFGGFSGTAGTVTLKVGDSTIGSGSLSASTDVTVTSTVSTQSGTILTVTVTGISKGVKAYFISYSYESGGGQTLSTIAVQTAPKTSYVEDETFDPTGLVITRNYTNPTSSDTYTYADHTSEFTFVPTTSTALSTSNTSVRITYDGKYCDLPITVSAAPSSGGYEKVTKASGVSAGDYLIVYESGNLAFNGGLETLDAVSNTINVTISNNKIASNATTNAAKFTVATVEGGYSIKSASGKFIGRTSNSNGMNTSATEAYVNTITIDESGNAVITSSAGPLLRYNSASNQARFRYYGSGQQAIQLYKLSSGETYTITYDANGGSDTMENSDNIVSDCGFTAPNGQEFDHWNTDADDLGDSYDPGDSVSSSCTLYAIWRDLTPSVTLDKDSVSLTTTAESSDTVEATITNITSPTYQWSRTAGDDCVTLTNATSSTVTIAPKGTTFATCTLTLTVNGSLGGKAITPIQKTVTVVVDKTPTQDNPYTVAEAKYAIDNNKTKSDVYVTGVVSQVVELTSGAINYYISDDGTTTDQFYVYKGKDKDGASFTNVSDVLVGDIVVIKGSITLYNSNVYEFSSNSQRVSYSRITVTGIAVKTAPSKVAYIPGTDFDPAGLVITVTYSNSSTEDVAYNDSTKTKFSFDKDTITENCNVTITYAGQTCTQAVTILTVKNVTGVASAPTEVYQGDPISGSSVTLNVLYSDDTTVGTVKADSVSVDTTSINTHVEATATYSAATGTKTATFYVDVIRKPTWDYIPDSIVADDCASTSSTYVDFEGLEKTSGAVYAGNTNKDGNKGIGLRSNNSNSGIVTTTSVGTVTKVTVEWNDASASGRTLDVYGKNTAYEAATDLYDDSTKGTKIGSIVYGTSTELTISDDYQFIAVRSNSGACYFNFIKFTWKVIGASIPLEGNPVLSTGEAASVSVGKTLPLVVTTNPVDSDEKLIVTVEDESVATVSGNDKNYYIHGVAIGSTTITVSGAKGFFESSTTITVNEAVKSFEDKIITPQAINVTGASYDVNDNLQHDHDGVSYKTNQVQMSSGAFQLKKNDGYIENSEALYSKESVDGKIKSITLFLNKDNAGTITVYEGTSKDPSTIVEASTTTGNVVTYTFSSGMTYFKIKETGNSRVALIDKFIIELADDTDTVLSKVRTAASTILTALKDNCGEGKSGFVSLSQWDALNSSLTALGLSSDEKLMLKEATRISLDNLSQGSVTIENAMAHYDACVTKFGYTPFDGITDAKASTRINPINAISKNSSAVIIVIIVSALSAAAIGGYFLFRRRKEQ